MERSAPHSCSSARREALLAPDELRRALLGEGREAFLRVLAREQRSELVRLGLEAAGVVDAEREIAQPLRERKAVDGGDRRPRHRLEEARGLVAEGAPTLRLLGIEPAHVLDVRTCDERFLPRAGQDDGANVGGVRELAQPVAQLGQRANVERVECVLTVDRDDGDAAFASDADAQASTAPLRKSTIALVGAPGPNTSATPCFFSSSASSVGIVPPKTTSTSSAPLSRSSSRMRGTSVMCAPERIEIPTASASSWIAVSAICSGVWCRPV